MRTTTTTTASPGRGWAQYICMVSSADVCFVLPSSSPFLFLRQVGLAGPSVLNLPLCVPRHLIVNMLLWLP